ncbi:peptidase inhibitor family I36 protein [Micromonospora sp. NBC_00330]|uniref:peptidase inhibitor family I36 protein n=1 Tax=Micromonospora sp. NBC_00330 TaxID=2903585 RepID=UPI002E2DD005|nr:peptidase inhibitor family I36 protein [Micromonospora sp. NBC_00330]
MRRIGTTLATLALVGTAVLTGAPAQAATSADASLALSCPSSGALCLYNNIDHTSILEVLNGSASLAGQYSDNKTSSVRNRSSCAYKLYRNSDRSDTPITVGPRTEIKNLGTFWGQQWQDSISYAQIYC